MKKQVNPVTLIAALVALVAVLAFVGIRLMGGTGTVSTPTAEQDKNRPATIEGKPVPPGVPYDYAQKAGQGTKP